MDIHSIHPLRQPDYVNRCGSNSGGCSHLCLPNRSGYTCACPPGLHLISPGGKTCTNQPGDLLIFAQKSELRLFPLNSTGEVDHVLPLTGVRSAVALDWDGASTLFSIIILRYFLTLHNKSILWQVKPFFGPTSSRMSSTAPSGTVPTSRRLSPTIWNRQPVFISIFKCIRSVKSETSSSLSLSLFASHPVVVVIAFIFIYLIFRTGRRLGHWQTLLDRCRNESHRSEQFRWNFT